MVPAAVTCRLASYISFLLTSAAGVVHIKHCDYYMHWSVAPDRNFPVSPVRLTVRVYSHGVPVFGAAVPDFILLYDSLPEQRLCTAAAFPEFRLIMPISYKHWTSEASDCVLVDRGVAGLAPATSIQDAMLSLLDQIARSSC